MNRFSFWYSVVWPLALVCVSVAPARAQRVSGPFAGLFGGDDKDLTQSLDLRASVFGAYDDNILSATRGETVPVDSRFQRSGFANGLTASLDYARRARQTQFRLFGNTAVQDLAVGSNIGNLLIASYNAGTGLTTALNSKTTFSVGGAARYAPFYEFAPFLKVAVVEDSVIVPGYNLAVTSKWVETIGASASISNKFSKRSSISLGVGWDTTQIPTERQSSIQTDSANVGLSHQVTRGLGVSVGYGVQRSRYLSLNGQRPVVNHNLAVGVNYGDGHALTFARRYALSFSVGTSAARSGNPADVVGTNKVKTNLHVNGTANLTRAIGRTWSAGVGYARGTQFIGAFREPLFTDSVNAGFGGLLLPRLHFSAGAGYTRGRLVFSSSSGYVGTYSGSAQLTYGIGRSLGLNAGYTYYTYSIPAGLTTFAFSPKLSRRAVSVGLSYWLPIIRERARPGDSG